MIFTSLEMNHCSRRRAFLDENSSRLLFCRLFRDQTGNDANEQKRFQQVIRGGAVTRNFKL